MRLDDVTIIAPTLNEVRNIGPFLYSLPEEIRLIIVDSSDDETPDLALKLRPKNTTVIRRKGCIAEARQWGTEAAETKWLLFTDVDITFAQDYFSRLARHKDVAAVYGPKLSLDRFRPYYRTMAIGQAICHRLLAPAATGSNMLLQRLPLLDVGGFDTALVCNEDSEVVWRLHRAGYQTRFDSELIVFARDHRRLESGRLRKTAHSLFRCALLYFNLMPDRWRSADWGYWSSGKHEERPGPTG